jgi:hypothetical protein
MLEVEAFRGIPVDSRVDLGTHAFYFAPQQLFALG